MAVLDDFLFLVVLVIPGFITVEFGRFLAGVADTSEQLETARSILLWSFIFDMLVVLLSPFIFGAQITGLDGLRQEIFDFNPEIVIIWLLAPLLFGLLYAIGLNEQIPARIRRRMQTGHGIIHTGNEPPWRNFFRSHEYVVASVRSHEDGELKEKLYLGQVIGYSAAKENRELRLYAPFKINDEGEWSPIYAREENEAIPAVGSEILISEENIVKVVSLPKEYHPVIEETEHDRSFLDSVMSRLGYERIRNRSGPTHDTGAVEEQ
jgi:hypothetical protein